MKSVMLSIKPQYCELIASGKKTIEVRKTKPKIKTPFKCYIYETKGKTEVPSFVDEEGHEIYQGRGQVIGEFVCAEITEYPYVSNFNSMMCGTHMFTKKDSIEMCLSFKEIEEYGGKKTLYGWHISNLIMYDNPKELSEFLKPCIYGEESDVSCFVCDRSAYAPDMHIDCFNYLTTPPQSWCYVEERDKA